MLVVVKRPFVGVNNVVKAKDNKKIYIKDNRVMTIDLSKAIKVLGAIGCCLEAGLVNGRKYDGI
jgi:hypothetical protein